MPVYEFACTACGAVEEHLLPLGAGPPGRCGACDGELRKKFSRVAVRYGSWGFTATDTLVSDERAPRTDFATLRERAERIADE